MVEIARDLIEKNHIEDCDVEILDTVNSLQAARNAMKMGASVIVARGIQAEMIRKDKDIPLIEIELTVQELGILIKKAKKLTDTERPKIAFFGYSNMFPDTTYINDLFDVDLRVYTFENRDEIEGMVYRAMIGGAEVICGGNKVLEYAESYGVKTMFLDATSDSIRSALITAQNYIDAVKSKKKNEAQFVAVMDAVYSGVISIDTQRVITNVNHTAEHMLNTTESRLIGKMVEKVLPELEIDYVIIILDGRREVVNTTFVKNNENYLITIVPVEINGEINGAIISLGRYSVQRTSDSPMSDSYFSGYLTDGDFSKIQTKNNKMKRCIELARNYALASNPVVIYGETGTEKEIFARGIHNNSAQKNGNYITINCSGMTEEQQIQVLFGDGENPGAIEQAAYGTLVVRDIDKLYLTCQYRLARAVRYKIFTKTDIESVPAVEFRLITTSREELGQKVLEGTFRGDLYYILNAFSLRIPPLRERVEDISDLVSAYIKRYNRKYYKRVVLTHGGMEEILSARWEGNALQLESFCERMVLTAEKRNIDEITIRQLLLDLYPVVSRSGNETAKESLPEPPEAELIRKNLMENSGSRQKTAEAMGISTATLWRKMKKFGIME